MFTLILDADIERDNAQTVHVPGPMCQPVAECDGCGHNVLCCDDGMSAWDGTWHVDCFAALRNDLDV
jgi:hypothetical protein